MSLTLLSLIASNVRSVPVSFRLRPSTFQRWSKDMNGFQESGKERRRAISLRFLLGSLILTTILNVALPIFVPTPPSIPLAPDVDVVRPLSTGK